MQTATSSALQLVLRLFECQNLDVASRLDAGADACTRHTRLFVCISPCFDRDLDSALVFSRINNTKQRVASDLPEHGGLLGG